MSQNALAALGKQRPWDFDVPDVKNALTPIMQGWDSGVQDRQRGIENERQNKLLSFQARAADRADQTAQREDDDAKVQRMGREASAIMNVPEAQRPQVWNSWIQRNPDVAAHAQKSGVDLSDYRNGPQFIATQAGQYDADKKRLTEAQLGLTRAQTAAANRREEPEIVRTMRAAGIDPSSPEGQQMIRQTIKGQGPLDQIIADAMRPQAQPAPQPPPAQGGLQQQSFEPGANGDSDPNLILAQSAPGQPQTAPQPPRDDPVVQTPVGPMLQSKARTLGFALALQGKGEAGKMMGDSPQPGALGKEGINHIDKTLIDKAMDLGELQSIKGAFRPEYLGLEGQAKGVGLGWADWLSGGKIDEQSKQFLGGYTRFATATTERLNNRIKALSGSAVSGAEEKRMYAANPSVGDGPEVFKNKLDQQIDMQRLAVARFNWIKTQWKGTDAQIADLAKTGRIEGLSSLDGMKQVIDKTLGEAEQKIRQQNPNIDQQTLRNQMKIIQRKAFGI